MPNSFSGRGVVDIRAYFDPKKEHSVVADHRQSVVVELEKFGHTGRITLQE
jgi:hypothetical protein